MKDEGYLARRLVGEEITQAYVFYLAKKGDAPTVPASTLEKLTAAHREKTDALEAKHQEELAALRAQLVAQRTGAEELSGVHERKIAALELELAEARELQPPPQGVQGWVDSLLDADHAEAFLNHVYEVRGRCGQKDIADYVAQLLVHAIPAKPPRP